MSRYYISSDDKIVRNYNNLKSSELVLDGIRGGYCLPELDIC